MIRCTKRGPRCPVDPTTDYINDYQQDQIAPSCMQPHQPHQPSSSYGQEDRPQQRTCRGKLSSSQLHPVSHQAQPSLSRAGDEMDSAGVLSQTRHIRLSLAGLQPVNPTIICR